MHRLAGKKNLNATRLHSKTFYSDKFQTLLAQQYLSKFTQPLHAPKLRGKNGPCVARVASSVVMRVVCTHLIDLYFWIWICTVYLGNYVTNKLTNFLFALGWITTIKSGEVNWIVPIITDCRIYLVTIIIDVRILDVFRDSILIIHSLTITWFGFYLALLPVVSDCGN